MRKLLVMMMALGLLLGACSTDQRPTLKVFNWGVYIDESLIGEFEELYNVRVIYETFESNEAMYTKLLSGEVYDVLVPSDYMVQRLIEENQLQSIDRSIVDLSELMPHVLDLSFDPGNRYSAPYFWGNVGILYNTNVVEEADLEAGWNIFLNTKYAGDVYFYDSERDAFLVALKALGYSANTSDDAELQAAYEWLTNLNRTMAPVYVTDDVIDNMIAGNKSLAIVYSGDAAYILDENEDMAYVVPEEGTNLWVDSMVIPANSAQPELANRWIAFMLSEDAQTRNTLEVGYTTTHQTVFDDMTAEGGDYEGNDAYEVRIDWPTDEIFRHDSELKIKMSDLWLRVKSQ